jgi:hypothetical protein
MWEDLVLLRGWTAEKYEEYVHGLIARALTKQTAAGSQA